MKTETQTNIVKPEIKQLDRGFESFYELSTLEDVQLYHCTDQYLSIHLSIYTLVCVGRGVMVGGASCNNA